MAESTSLLTRHTETYREFESLTLRINERRNSSLTYWYIKNYPPRSGIGAERLTIHDPLLNDVRVVLPAATLARFEKNYLSLTPANRAAILPVWLGKAGV